MKIWYVGMDKNRPWRPKQLENWRQSNYGELELYIYPHRSMQILNNKKNFLEQAQVQIIICREMNKNFKIRYIWIKFL